MTGITFKLLSITRPVSVPDGTQEAGKTPTATYYEGDPEFDTYQAECRAHADNMSRMISQENGLPKNFFSIGSEGTAQSGAMLAVQVGNAFASFYRGEIDEKALETSLANTVADLRSSYIAKGFSEEEFMPQLLEDLYEISRLYNIRGAGEASWYEGRALSAEQYGSTEHLDNFIYYNSDYYYRSEEMKGTLKEMIQKLAKQYDVDPSALNLSDEYPDGDIRKGVYSSYNTIVNSYAREQHHIGNMIDETMIPPRGFRFLYCGNESGTNPMVSKLSAPRDEPEAFFDGVLQIWYGDWSFTGRVPVRQNHYQFPISVNMFDVVNAGSKTPIPTEITDFLHNMDFFTTTQSQTYAQSHPRHF